MDADLIELIVELAEAVDHAQVELEMIADTETPLPDRLLKQLEERDAMKATMRRMIEESGSPAVVRERAQSIFREEMAKASRSDDAGKTTVLPEVVQRLVLAEELLRRRALLEPDLAFALRAANFRSDFAGC